MVFRLCQHVQEFLHAHNKPPSKSFYEEMIYNRQLQEQKQARQAEKRLELERQREHKQVSDNLLIALIDVLVLLFPVNCNIYLLDFAFSVINNRYLYRVVQKKWHKVCHAFSYERFVLGL